MTLTSIPFFVTTGACFSRLSICKSAYDQRDFYSRFIRLYRSIVRVKGLYSTNDAEFKHVRRVSSQTEAGILKTLTLVLSSRSGRYYFDCSNVPNSGISWGFHPRDSALSDSTSMLLRMYLYPRSDIGLTFRTVDVQYGSLFPLQCRNITGH